MTEGGAHCGHPDLGGLLDATSCGVSRGPVLGCPKSLMTVMTGLGFIGDFWTPPGGCSMGRGHGLCLGDLDGCSMGRGRNTGPWLHVLTPPFPG